jgi:hypothetical protein
MRGNKVTFYYPYPDEVSELSNVRLNDYEFWSHEGKERRRAWILQTYLWLRREGYSVLLSGELPKKGIVVLLVEPEIVERFQNQFSKAHRSLFILTVRADIIGFRPLIGDADVVQNGRFADEKRVFFVPHWPQPGIIRRDPERGARIENIVFKGGFGSLHEDFHSSRWYDYLDSRSLNFEIASAETEGKIPRWHDYSKADLTLAVRPPFGDGGLRCEKPASKLVNSWHAEVPALLGPEYAYRELRKSDLDYIEVCDVDEAMRAIDFLRANRERYLAMVEQGRQRAREFTHEQITKRWAEMLFDHVPKVKERPSFRLSRTMPLHIRKAFNYVVMPPATFEFRKQIGYITRKVRAE